MMWKNEYKPPRLKSSDLRIPVTFYEYEEKQGPLPGQKEKKILFECLAKIDGIWLKDMERAKQNGTLSEVTVIIRDPIGSYVPTNKHYIEINDDLYPDHYNIKHVQPDVQDRSFINIIGKLAS
ncbi:phage head-tail adapter protein [Bacillus sp. J14TS2]|uniref:phage head-tail adapter protein n=1 Tax=Bacillus sp. J14TS2 TaxID=2807188 RepID=UPI001FD04832|nr:phage head-tail adapter protein [Bacillus sp. J14TS2]